VNSELSNSGSLYLIFTNRQLFPSSSRRWFWLDCFLVSGAAVGLLFLTRTSFCSLLLYNSTFIQSAIRIRYSKCKSQRSSLFPMSQNARVDNGWFLKRKRISGSWKRNRKSCKNMNKKPCSCHVLCSFFLTALLFVCMSQDKNFLMINSLVKNS
jgi:hypothetical protein